MCNDCKTLIPNGNSSPESYHDCCGLGRDMMHERGCAGVTKTEGQIKENPLQHELHCEYLRSGGTCNCWEGRYHKDVLPEIPIGNGRKETRTFETGATRDTDEGKYDYEGFLSPLVLERYAEYMHKNRKQSDGNLREGDNWQKGIPLSQYMKSKFRHFMTSWKLHRIYFTNIIYGEKRTERMRQELEESLCAELFNTMGYLFELLKEDIKHD